MKIYRSIKFACLLCVLVIIGCSQDDVIEQEELTNSTTMETKRRLLLPTLVLQRVLIEYSGYVTPQQKQHARAMFGAELGLIEYSELDQDSDLWYVTVATNGAGNRAAPDTLPICCTVIILVESEPDDVSIQNATDNRNP